MARFGPDGVTIGKGVKRRFDAARMWTVVRALLAAPGPGIAHIFIYAPLREQMLDHARAIGEPEGVIDYAALVMSQPSDSAPHDDHLHVRILCQPTDGVCVDPSVRSAAKKPSVRTQDVVKLAEQDQVAPVMDGDLVTGQ
jgi:penicillin-insensitive murein endopeptidase